MKTSKTSIVLVCMLFGLLCGLAGAAENEPAAAAPDPSLGEYKGRLSLNYHGKMKEYDFLIEILQIDQKSGKVVIRVASDFYRSKEITRKNCRLVPDKPATAFICKGDDWHEDYELKGDGIKASCISSKNDPYSMSATKVAK
jgi:hypothetical protein